MHQPVLAERYFAGPALPAAQACQHDDASALASALAAAHLSPNTVGEQGMSLLLLAMSNGSKNAVRKLLRLGADPNLRTQLGRNRTPVQPVALAAGGDDKELLTILLNGGGDPNAKFGGLPATFCAANSDRYDHLHLLLERGADINATEDDGTTLMLRLALLNQFGQVANLIKLGGDVHKANRVGGTVAFEVQETRHTLVDSLERRREEVEHLLEARGVTFPVPHPGIAFQAKVRRENAQKRQWQTTTEGQRWITRIAAAEGDPTGSNDAFRYRRDAEKVFQAWRKTQPDWFATTSEGPAPMYNSPPSLAEDEAAAADSARSK